MIGAKMFDNTTMLLWLITLVSFTCFLNKSTVSCLSVVCQLFVTCLSVVQQSSSCSSLASYRFRWGLRTTCLASFLWVNHWLLRSDHFLWFRFIGWCSVLGFGTWFMTICFLLRLLRLFRHWVFIASTGQRWDSASLKSGTFNLILQSHLNWDRIEQ